MYGMHAMHLGTLFQQISACGLHAGLRLLQPRRAAQCDGHALWRQHQPAAAVVDSGVPAQKSEMMQPRDLAPDLMQQAPQQPPAVPQCHAATQALVPPLDAGQLEAAAAASMQSNAAEAEVPVLSKSLRTDSCTLWEAKLPAAPDDHLMPSLPPATTADKQALRQSAPISTNAVLQQAPLAAECSVVLQQQPPWPAHSNMVNIRLELGGAAQPCCNCSQQCAHPRHQVDKEQQQLTQLHSSQHGAPQLPQPILPAATRVVDPQLPPLVRQSLLPQHIRSADHRDADNGNEQPRLAPIWTVLPAHNRQVMVQDKTCGTL
jgi:hypothetical protein